MRIRIESKIDCIVLEEEMMMMMLLLLLLLLLRILFKLSNSNPDILPNIDDQTILGTDCRLLIGMMYCMLISSGKNERTKFKIFEYGGIRDTFMLAR